MELPRCVAGAWVDDDVEDFVRLHDYARAVRVAVTCEHEVDFDVALEGKGGICYVSVTMCYRIKLVRRPTQDLLTQAGDISIVGGRHRCDG